MRLRHRVVAALGPVGVIASGCFPQFGDYTETGGGAVGGNGGEGGTGGLEPCTVPEPETCTNGRDDDCDGKTDCEDEDCTAYRCVPSDAFSEGPFLLSLGAPSDAEACPDGAPEVLEGVEIVEAQASCSCPVQPASGAECESAILHTFMSVDDCSIGDSQKTVNATCTNLGNVNLMSGFATAVPTTNGTCTAGPPTLSVVDPVVQSRRLCGAQGGGCGPDSVCVGGPPATGFEQIFCVMKDGVHPADDCPPTYANSLLVVGDEPLDDSRSCPDCTYDAANSSCSGNIVTYQSGSCVGANGGFIIGDPCVAQVLGLTSAEIMNLTTNQGTCSPVDAMPAVIGELRPSGAKTLCCSDPL